MLEISATPGGTCGLQRRLALPRRHWVLLTGRLALQNKIQSGESKQHSSSDMTPLVCFYLAHRELLRHQHYVHQHPLLAEGFPCGVPPLVLDLLLHFGLPALGVAEVLGLADAPGFPERLSLAKVHCLPCTLRGAQPAGLLGVMGLA